jgi:signal transduction histidine kinase
MSSTPTTQQDSASESPEMSFLSGGGEMGARMRALDWFTSAVGPAADWPQSLKTAVSICIGSRYPIVIWWGNPEYTMFYNDGYIPILGVTKHPGWLGRSGRDCWKEIWSTVGPMLAGVFETGVATWSENLLLVMERNIPREENYFTFSYSPIRDDAGKVPGIFCACYESTGQVIGERRLQTLRDLGRTVTGMKSAEAACAAAAKTLELNPHDVPFALLYLLNDKAQTARLTATTGFKDTANTIPEQVALSESAALPFQQVFATGVGEVVSDLCARFGPLPGGPWPEPAEAAYVLPIAVPGMVKPTGFLVAGLSPRRVIDADYRSFFDLIAGHVGTAIANAQAYQAERKRAEALAEIDRAKTAFFSNVSHEFRTPLTLMLGPLEEALTEAGLMPDVRERLDVAHRNSVRLLKLVNTLLDFSRIEAGRIEAVYERVDLCTLTRELASVFRSAIEKARLNFVVNCEPLSAPVYVDREMWEKIVFNLVSNAFKFTFEGEIKVSLKEKGDRVELAVSDTGTGIPEDDLKHLFERFHRVKGARGRSYEGSGIGLALVQELVKLHGGSVSAVSEIERGSTFTVSIPMGADHLPADRVGGSKTMVSTGLRGEAYVDEVVKWLPVNGHTPGHIADTPSEFATVPDVAEAQPAVRPRILLADDNADMRDYVRRLLSSKYEVEAVGDGDAAVEAAREQQFDLVLSDVMMPKLDGFGVLHALRSDEKTRTIPVILLSARAGEESRVEGLGAGADDYLVKPFSARELLARVESHINLQRERKRSAEKLEQLILLEQQARASAEVANRVKDEFLAMLSHELRTPLNAIVGWTHLLKSGALRESDRARGIDVIDRNASAQRAIIDELLDVSRIITGKLRLEPKPLDPVSVVEAAVDAIRPAALAKEIEIVVSVERNRGLVVGEAVRLQQVIWNLLSNAVKFTPKNGRVEVGLKVRGRHFEITVSDTGEGISPEFLPYIFERFRQADTSARRKHGGLGVGLSIVRSLVELHGGEVDAASDGPGKGTTFTIRLPIIGLSDADATQTSEATQLFDSRWRQKDHVADDDVHPTLLTGLRVLTVDDQQDTRDLITLALVRYGADVRASDSATAALATIAEWQPNVIVSDIGLPEMDGYDFMRALRKTEGDGSRIPAIALTGYAGAVDESKALNAGYELHFSKPINLNELAHAIARLSKKT